MDMMATLIPTIYDELIDFLVDKASPEEILAFKPSPRAQMRAEVLLDRNNAGVLTPEEQLELEQMLYFERRVALLKAQAAQSMRLSC
jgi:hypothetical protein